MSRKQTFRLFAGSFLFLALCQVANRLLDPPIVCNKGIGLGIDIHLFTLIPLVSLSLIIAIFLVRKILHNEIAPPLLISFGASFLIGGALSNIEDRLAQGCIPDYFVLGWFPAFNLADIGISGGVIILIISFLKTSTVIVEKSNKKNNSKF